MTGVTSGLLVLIAIGVVASAILHGRVSRGSSPPEELEFYQVAYLAGGPSRVAEVALSYLVWAGLVDVRSAAGSLALVSAPNRAVELAPVEKALVATIPPEGRTPGFPLGAAREAAAGVADRLSGLVVPPGLSLLALAPAVGASIIAAGIATAVMLSVEQGTPTGFLAIVPLVGVIVVLTAVSGRSRLTETGQQALADVRAARADDLALAELGVTSLPIESGLYIVALYGRPAMTGGLLSLRRLLG
ncbi:MAG: TIGR04222 domain-containing membrane protein [Acidimicrobiia bacterium]|nr:TIGR04222 domain-containing membrane protein [Acidimicrobiia bacterium]MDH4306326.1 TIGR04222 domain-containing membrane protein [Acidimicrobiia bacterium]MDH5294181.1 TIGR04222 domain-containing membrane protein [Acidimicrobiia bacterium]